MQSLSLGSDVSFPPLQRGEKERGEKVTRPSKNLDVQSAVRLTRREVSKDKVIFTSEDIAASKKEWENAMVGTILGASPLLRTVQDFVQRAWINHVPTVRMLPRGIFMMKFQKMVDME